MWGSTSKNSKEHRRTNKAVRAWRSWRGGACVEEKCEKENTHNNMHVGNASTLSNKTIMLAIIMLAIVPLSYQTSQSCLAIVTEPIKRSRISIGLNSIDLNMQRKPQGNE